MPKSFAALLMSWSHVTCSPPSRWNQKMKKAHEPRKRENKGELVRDDIDSLTGPNDTFLTWLIHSTTQSGSSQPTFIFIDLLSSLLPYIFEKVKLTKLVFAYLFLFFSPCAVCSFRKSAVTWLPHLDTKALIRRGW